MSDYLDKINEKKKAAYDKSQSDKSLETVKSGSDAVVHAITQQAAKSRSTTQKVKVENNDLAQKEDVQQVVDSINRLNVTTFLASKDNWTQVVEDMATAAERIQSVVDGLETSGVKKIEKSFSDAVKSLQEVVSRIKDVEVKSDSDVKNAIDELSYAVKGIELNPVINIPEQKVVIDEHEVDLSPLVSLLKEIKQSIDNNKVQIPKTDMSEVEAAIRRVDKSINNMVFPVPNYILPFRDVNGKAVQVQLDSGGNLPINASISGADGAITDGVDSGIKATVFNLTDSNALATQVVDSNGDAVTSFGGGTEYDDGSATPATPKGGTVTFADGVTMQAVATAHPLPVNDASVSAYAATSASDLDLLASTIFNNGLTNRLTVDLITDVAGVKGGSGVITSDTLRTTLATDDPAVTSLASINTIQTNKSQFTKLTDGTDTALITASGEQNVIATPQPGTDIGDVTINNGSGAAAVNIQDGGNSITIDGSVGVSGTVAVSSVTTSVVPGTGATHLGKAEDAGHSSGDTGVMALAVRNDGGAALATTDADYIPLTTDSKGALRSQMGGFVSTNNSSSATLTANSVFTGTSDDAIDYNEIRVTVIASHASATNGLSIQQSSDNSNWDIIDTYTIPATTGKTYAVPRDARYVRVVYTNGGTNQTSFRLQTILNRTGATTTSQRPQDAYTNETDMQQVWAATSVYNGTTWDLAREVANATNSTGTGIAAAGVLAQFDDSSPTSITENQFGNLRMSANRNLYNTIRDAAGNERGANVNASNQLSVSVDNSNVSTNIAQIGGNTISTGVGATGTGVIRTVEANGAGRTLAFKGGSVASSGDNTLVSAGTNKLKVYAFSLSTTSTTAVTCKIEDGASGTVLWQVVLQAPTSVSTGANLAVNPPSYLFATSSATLLNLNLSSAQTVHYSVAYFDEA